MINKKTPLMMHLRTKYLKNNYKNSTRYLEWIPIIYNELRSHDCPSQLPRQIHWRPIIFYQYLIIILPKQKGNNIQICITKISNEQINGGSNYHMFTNTTMFTYIRPVKCNVRNKISENPLKKVCTCHHKIIPKQSL